MAAGGQGAPGGVSVLVAGVIGCIVTRTPYWPVVTAAVALVLLAFDPGVFKRVAYALLLTFVGFFIFGFSPHFPHREEMVVM